MKTEKCLTNDISRRIYVSDSSRQPYRKGPTAQFSPHPSAAVSALARGGPQTRPELFHLRAPGLSLPRAGTATQAPSPGRRCQSILHRQAFAPSRRATPHLRRYDRIDVEQGRRQPCLLGGPAPWGRSWLTGRALRREPSHLEYHFDRLLPDKLAQAYELLASDRCWSIAPSPQPASCPEVVEMNKPAALYARVSSDRQKENHTIASQVAALTQYAETDGYLVPPEWRFQDDGYRGATLVRPGLEALRDLAAAGEIQTVLILLA